MSNTDEKAINSYYNSRHQEGYYTSDFTEGGYELRRCKRIFYLLNKLDLENDRYNILDYGCGQGRYTGILEKLFYSSKVYGCDISEVAIEKAKTYQPNCYFTKICGTTIYLNGTFDLVLSVEVFEHVENIETTLDDIARILRKGGYLVFSTPCANPWSLEYTMCRMRRNGIECTKEGYKRFYFEDSGHLRRLDSKDIRKLLEDRGFTLVTVQYDNHFFGALQWMWGDRLKSAVKNIRQSTVIKKVVKIGLLSFLPIAYLIDGLSWAERKLAKTLPNGSVMFGVFRKV